MKFRVTRKIFLHSGVPGNDRGNVFYAGDVVDLPVAANPNEKCLEAIEQVVRRVEMPAAPPEEGLKAVKDEDATRELLNAPQASPAEKAAKAAERKRVAQAKKAEDPNLSARAQRKADKEAALAAAEAEKASGE